jgi:DNA-binding MarR family transcriptional regulator
MTGDSYDACANELMTFVRSIKRLSHNLPAAEGAPTLERPAFGLLYMTAECGPARPSMLAERVEVDLSTASRQLAALESSGWVTRERDPDDRRAFLVRATDEGRRVLALNTATRKAVLRNLLDDWSEPERLEFTRLLGRLNETLARRNAAMPNTASPVGSTS